LAQATNYQRLLDRVGEEAPWTKNMM